MVSTKDNRWAYLDVLRLEVKAKLKGDPTLAITQDDIMELEIELRLSRATLERFFGIDKTKTAIYPRRPTKDKLASYLGFNNYNTFVKAYLQKAKRPLKKVMATLKKRTNYRMPTNKQEIVRQYATKLVETALLLASRLKEILAGRGTYLLAPMPNNDIHTYNYISTLYRFCELLGWLRAAKRQLIYFEFEDQKIKQKINNAIHQFQKTLANERSTELIILKDICCLWQLNLYHLSRKEQSVLAANLRVKLQQQLALHQVDSLKQLSSTMQLEVLNNLAQMLQNTAFSPNSKAVTKAIVAQTQQVSVQQLERPQAWIYLDWQSAIGDFMIIEIQNASQRFEIIGYGDFEEYYLSGVEQHTKWIKRVEKLFKGLDINKAIHFDARILHLQQIYISTIPLIEHFTTSLGKGGENTHHSSLRVLKDFMEKLKRSKRQEVLV